MLFLTRWFGVTGSDADRDLAREQSDIEGITESVLLMQANAAAKQHRPLARGTHAKGVSSEPNSKYLTSTIGRDAGLAARLAKGMFATPGVYPAVVRFGNADSKKNSDFKGRHPIVIFLGRSHSGGHGGIRGAHRPTGLLSAKRDDPAHKRLAGNDREPEVTGGIESRSLPVVPAVQG